MGAGKYTSKCQRCLIVYARCSYFSRRINCTWKCFLVCPISYWSSRLPSNSTVRLTCQLWFSYRLWNIRSETFSGIQRWEIIESSDSFLIISHYHPPISSSKSSIRPRLSSGRNRRNWFIRNCGPRRTTTRKLLARGASENLAVVHNQ